MTASSTQTTWPRTTSTTNAAASLTVLCVRSCRSLIFSRVRSWSLRSAVSKVAPAMDAHKPPSAASKVACAACATSYMEATSVAGAPGGPTLT